MIEGHVTDALDPVIGIGLMDDGEVETFPVIVDTGFSGALCLSLSRFGDASFPFLYRQLTELSDGSVIEEAVFEGRILFDGEERTVRITLTDSMDSFIGAALLHNCTLYIDYPARTVRIA